MHGRLFTAVERLRTPRIFVVGDLILDRYVWGSVHRISPEAPVQILDAGREEFRPGGAANVANNLAVLGARTSCAGTVGDDLDGRSLAERMRACGVDARGIVVDRVKPTIVKTRLIAHNQQMLRIDREKKEPLASPVERRLTASIRRAAATHEAAVVSDYNKGTLTPEVCRSLIDAFARRKRPVIVGLKSRDFRKYRGSTAASLNRVELAQISGVERVEEGARRIIAALGLKFILITLGERGLMVMARSGEVVRMPTMARQVYDVTGAGDTVLAAFVLGYVSGLSLEECAVLANGAAGVVVGKIGTATVTRGELIEYATAAEGSSHRKVLAPAALRKALAEERSRGHRIAFTNGCFDLLHVGHVRLLEFARAKGDVLVVGLNTDRSVRRLKGDARPILGQDERAALLAALECVDYVTFFDEDTPDRLVRTLRPEVLVKGMDYRGKRVVGRDFVESYGGRVELAPLVEGVSTTDIVRRIRGTCPVNSSSVHPFIHSGVPSRHPASGTSERTNRRTAERKRGNGR
ncbi:MAG: D-glycero-beta-D-manno-heptose 1-phosphate adenylyltransferase [Planctomycetes bacterium]|nr:D-glycero-beta-D-manno-heptose 1-phosphate adenylyltransferase [Planctomycetota bacterium]